MRRLIFDKKIKNLPWIVRNIWYTKNIELEQQMFNKLPKWMAPEDAETDDRRDIKHLVGEAFEALSPREAKIFRLRYWHDLTLEEVGQMFELTRERIRQIENNALRKLRSYSKIDELKSFADLNERASIRIEKKQKTWLKQCDDLSMTGQIGIGD